MSLRGLLTFNSAIDSMRDSAKNLQAITEARQKMEQDKQIFDIKKKEAELQLKNEEIKGQRSQLEIDYLRDALKNQTKNDKAILKGNEAALNQEEHANAMAFKSSGSIAEQLFNNDSHVKAVTQQQVAGPVIGEDTTIDNTPEAIDDQAQLFDDIPSSRLAMNSSGKIGAVKVDASDELFRRILDYKKKNPDIALKPEAQALFDKKMGVKGGYNRGSVVRAAIDMASKSQLGATPENVRAMIPEAEKILYPDAKTGAITNNELPEPQRKSRWTAYVEPKKDKYGYKKGEIKTFPNNPNRPGEYEYIGDGKFKRIR